MSVSKFHSSTTPLKKDQVYNWFDKYNANQGSQAYVMNQQVKEKSKTNFGRRMFRFAQS
ncbi:exodeoxyribonuclease VII large subunit [Alteromonas sp. A079]|uniref:exodeoxyribonuclease VII large subunit n=1 Tax=Alteromonas sp. A079 TaxID=3410268 RepID=UPI003BA1B5C5